MAHHVISDTSFMTTNYTSPDYVCSHCSCACDLYCARLILTVAMSDYDSLQIIFMCMSTFLLVVTITFIKLD